MAYLTASYAFYRIDECGFYKYKKRNRVLSNTQSACDELSVWLSKAKNIYETVTFEPQEDSDECSVYCYDFCKKKSLVITTWNATPTEDGKISAIDGSAKPGKADVKASDFPEGYIPGHPTYFWIIPEKDIFLTIRFGVPNNGKSNFCRYLQNYLSNCSQYRYEISKKDGNVEVKFGESLEEAQVLRPAFNATRLHMPGKIEMIRGLRPYIYKVIQKSKIKPFVKDEDRTLWQSVLHKFGVQTASIVDKAEIDFSAEYAYNPTSDELDQIIKNWKENSTRQFDDVGFKVGKVKEVLWLSGFFATGEILLDLAVNAQQVVEAESLLDNLENHREQILANLKVE